MTEIKFRTYACATVLALASAGLVAGCGGSDDPATDDDAGQGAGGDSGTGTVDRSDSGTATDGATGGADDGGGPGPADDAGSGDDDAGAVVGPPSFSAGAFRQVGRYGHDARIDVTGTSGGEAVLVARVSIFNAAGEAVALDANGDGQVDGTEVEIALSSEIAADSGEGKAFVLLAGLPASDATLDHARVTLLDLDKNASETLTLTYAPQPELAADERCDPTYLDNRCGPDLGCKGEAPLTTCTPGVAPTIDRVGYFDDALGGRMLIEVTDPDDDIASFTVFYMDESHAPVRIDTNGDQIDDADHLQFTADYPGSGGKFFTRLDAAQAILDVASSISVVVTDRGGRSSAGKTANKASAPARQANQACDTRNFDRCATGSVCVPGATPYVGKCTVLSTARTDACSAALVLDPANGITSVHSNVGYPSLWDPDEGCRKAVARPEAHVMLTLAAHADRVTLSTDHDYTNFDTILYVLPSCTATPSTTWCWDDLSGMVPHAERTTATLTNLDAGDYFIVVDSFPAMSGGTAFELSVEVE